VRIPYELPSGLNDMAEQAKKQKYVSALDAILSQVSLCCACLPEYWSPLRIPRKALAIDIGIQMRKV
jgi:hypothetical protein